MHKLETLTVAAVVALSTAAMGQTTIYVDDDAPLGGDGTSWSSAFRYLQDAFATAGPGDEIRVGAGMYMPDQDEGGNVTVAERTETFQLMSGVQLRGGYVGIGASNPDKRNAAFYETVLSGDLLSDDMPGFVNNEENSLHVVTGSGADLTAVVDGFTIVGGNASGSSDDSIGGGIFIDGGSPTIVNCVILDCWAYDGAGAVILGSGSPTIISCLFLGNVVGPQGLNPNGAGLWIVDSSPVLLNCTFTSNSAVAGSGGGIYIAGGSYPTVTNCILWGNTDDGGTDESAQVYVAGGTPVITYSCIQGCTTFCMDALNHNISDDPMLTANGHLSPGSVAIDAGNTSVLPAGLYVDLNSSSRVLDDTCTGDTGVHAAIVPVTVDLGAYEYVLRGDIVSDGEVNLSDLAELLANYGAGCD